MALVFNSKALAKSNVQYFNTGGIIDFGNSNVKIVHGTDKLSIVGGNFLLDASAYLNWSTTSGSSGYGLRDYSGQIQFKDSGGSWTAFNAGAATNYLSRTGTVLSPATSGDTLDLTSTVNQGTVSQIIGSQTAATLQDGSAWTGTDYTMTTQYVAVKIIASAAHTMGDFQIRVKASGTITNPTANLVGYIYADDGGGTSKPTGSALATGKNILFGTLTTSYQVLSLGTTYTMTNGASYWLVIKYSDVPTGADIVFDTTTGTNLGATSTDGSSWTNTNNRLYNIVRGLTYRGVYGSSTNSYGVRGTSTNSIGVYGDSTNSYGVRGDSINSYGVRGSSTNSYGVRGSSTNSYGVYGTSTNNYSGYFSGGLGLYSSNLLIVGTATAASLMTVGIAVRQGSADDYIYTGHSTDVAHGMTTLADTDGFFGIMKYSPTEGGVAFRGFSETNIGMSIGGYVTTEDNTRSTSGVAAVMVRGLTASGTTAGDMAAGKNIFAIRNNATTAWICGVGGNTWQSGNIMATGVGPYAFGVDSVSGRVQFLIGGNFTSNGSATSVTGQYFTSALTAAVGDTGLLAGIITSNSITTQGATETIALIAQAYFVEPNITVGAGDTVTEANTVYISGAPTEATTNWALKVASGATKLLALTTDGGLQTFGANDSAGAGYRLVRVPNV